MSYNPSAVGVKGSIFGFPYTLDEAEIVLIPVPHDVTTSYAAGTAKAPNRILEESSQLDLSVPGKSKPSETKIAMDKPLALFEDNDAYRKVAKAQIDRMEQGKEADPKTPKPQNPKTPFISNLLKRNESKVTFIFFVFYSVLAYKVRLLRCQQKIY